jgi:molybdenum cofactor cytidylyltransferase
MGRDKAALPWLGDTLLLPWLVETLEESGWNPIVVVGPRTDAFWKQRLPEAILRLNPHPERGKTTSVTTGLRALPPNTGPFLVTAVDQPRPRELYELLAAKAGGSSILMPDNNGHRGHPIVFPGRFLNQMATLEEDTLGLRGFLDSHREETSLLPYPAEWLQWDLNTPGAYEQALEWFRTRQIES